MSSETSTEPAGLSPWHFFVIAALIAATAAVLMATDTSPGNLVLRSLGIVAAGIAGAGLYRVVAPLVQPERDESAEPLHARARAGLEREKNLVLRSIKELEFDRAMGKVAQADYDDMVARLRARALGLMRQLQEEGGPYREAIERELQSRLAADGTPAARRVVERGAPVAPLTRTCPSCATANDADARFCKRCGAPLAGEQSAIEVQP